ncbi:MAG TPA: hypothetical protein VMY06_09285 [Sedimentisphaerales bacterium]|nr:hypothetical protein [Sedimentisphaerales bacterium]
MRLDKRILMNMVLAVFPVCLLLLSPGLAQSGGPYVLDWSTIDGGGGRSSGGPYVLTGTIGQPDAAYSSGGKYELLGGFWPGGPLCIVSFDDYARFAQLWRNSGAGLPADLDGSGEVDFADLKDFANLWLACCPVGWPLK